VEHVTPQCVLRSFHPFRNRVLPVGRGSQFGNVSLRVLRKCEVHIFLDRKKLIAPDANSLKRFGQTGGA
jgi:hypothetical protein